MDRPFDRSRPATKVVDGYENAPSNFTTLNHMENNLFRKAPGKHSLRTRRHTAAWDDDYLVSLIAA